MRFKMHVCSWHSAVRIEKNSSIRFPVLPYTRGMIPVILSGLPLLLQESGDEPQRELYRQWSALMLILALLCIITVTAFAFIVTRRRARRRMESLPKKKNAPIADAWTESGKRMDDSIMEFRDD